MFMINLHPVIDGLCRLSMSFANEKMRERTKFYSKDTDFSFLHEALGKEVLPEEYGGTNGTMKSHVGKIIDLSSDIFLYYLQKLYQIKSKLSQN